MDIAWIAATPWIALMVWYVFELFIGERRSS